MRTARAWSGVLGALVGVLTACAPEAPAPTVVDPAARGPASGSGSGPTATGEGRPHSAGLVSTPLPVRTPRPGRARFESIDAAAAGIDFRNRWVDDPERPHEFANAFSGGGVALGDYDGDGRPDLYLTRPAGGGRLYRNLGDFKFEDVTAKVGLGLDGWTTGPVFADIDGDADLDLFVGLLGAPNRLYVNSGGRFEERGAALGLDFRGASVAMAFGDYDHDGDLDGYLVTNRLAPKEPLKGEARIEGGRPVVPEAHREYVALMQRGGEFISVNAGQADHLYRNDGGRFTDVTAAAGLGGHEIGLSARWWDFDDDGRLDLYVANDFWGDDHLYRNAGDGRFVDLARLALPHTPWFSMGVEAGDLDGDGRLDLFTTDMSGSTHYKQVVSMGDRIDDGWFMRQSQPPQRMRNALFLNTGAPRFLEVAGLAGVADTDWTWSPRLADLDDDGRLDVFLTAGMTRDFSDSDVRERLKRAGKWQSGDLDAWRATPVRRERSLAFRNTGELRFVDMADEWGLDALGVSFGAAIGDLDGDGDLDVVVNEWEAPPRLHRNQGAEGHRVRIRLVGTRSPRQGAGARIEAETAAGRQVRDLATSSGFMSADEPVVHFGLGTEDRLRRLAVRWPSGVRQAFDDLPADQLFTITEPEASPAPLEAPVGPLFAMTRQLGAAVHVERPVDDFARQPLLPWGHSRLGPGLAAADIDGDGDDDLFVSGASGQPSRLLRNQGGGRFEPDVGPFAADVEPEDLGAVFFDVDADADLDLYVATGGAEFEAGNAALRDRLYLNDGHGAFTRAPGAIPDARHEGGPVAAADLDGDGDLDLFLGGRVALGRYPDSPTSRLLRTERGHLVDITGEFAPGLLTAGMVSAATFADVDGDRRPELVVATEWGPIRLWRNVGGRLREFTAEAGLKDRTGLWSAVAATDLDADGDLDLVAGNLGTNTPYRAPARLHVFPGPRGHRVVEARREGSRWYPVRGRPEMMRAWPDLEARFPTFDAFGRATLTDLFGEAALEKAPRLEAATLESGVFRNDGRGRFTFEPLPWQAQVAPVFGIALADFDLDGHGDVYLAQNSTTSVPETGPMNGGVGVLFRGSGKGGLSPVPPAEAGLLAPAEARAAIPLDLDGRPGSELVVALNGGPLLAYARRAQAGPALEVRLAGRPGNPTGIGAQVVATRKGGASATFVLHAGGGHLSQAPPVATFALGAAGPFDRVRVAWPDGERSEVEVAGAERLVVPHPKARPR